MSVLRLFSVFHANLDFSAIPDRDLPRVIERCYWPLLVLAEQASLPLGLELPARTLRRVAQEDPEWLKTFRGLAERGLVEAVGSGWAQLIGPLVPVDANRANLELGRRAYAEILGEAPGTWFVAEQTFAPGLAPLYHEVGARALVVEWNNPASRRPELRPLRFAPARLGVGDDADLQLLWNDCVFFQKLQRAAQGLIPPREYLEAVARAASPHEERLLCAYGGDLEIFDYRPGAPEPPGGREGVEMHRLSECLRALHADPRFEFRLPRDAARDLAPGPVVELASAEDPIPCKKQPRYNPTRWAVSGRDAIGMNTRCFALRRSLRALDALENGRNRAERDADLRTLATLWGSDFRTRATEEKVEAFHERMGAAHALAQQRLEAAAPRLGDGEDVVLVNASDEPWTGHPVEVPLRLAPGRLREAAVRAVPEAALAPGAAQLEVSGRYRDGSLREAILVLEPELAPGACLRLRLEPAPPLAGSAEAGEAPDGLRTEAVEASFLPHRGGALAALRFPGQGPAPLAGSVPHGCFDDIAYTPDFYSGHVVAVGEDGSKTTDLGRAAAWLCLDGPVRVGVGFRVRTPLGEWSKLWRAYRRRPRLDLVHGLSLHEARVASLRLGSVTLLPDAWERASLGYACVNGGDAPDFHALAPGARVEQQRAVSSSVSATSCLGATEGWVALGDARRGLAVIGDRSQWAVAPLLEFADVDGRPFLRLHHTAAETDETRATFLRGHQRVGFALVGYAGDVEAVRQAARAAERGLVYRTEARVGIARSV